MTIRILVADDHEIFVEGLCGLLENEPGLDVIGRLANGEQAVHLSREKVPDVVLMDLSMPGLSGIEATRLIKAERPAVRVLCLSMHSDHGFVMGALNAGASGYVLKDGAKKELLHAIAMVMNDEVYLSPGVARTVVNAATFRADSDALAQLTEREREVLKLLAKGKTTREIADRLHLSVKTIGTHRVHIMDKLGVDSIAALVKFSIREGLTSVAD